MSNQYTVEKSSTFDGWRQKYNALAEVALTDADRDSLSLQNWTESIDASAPNDTIPVVGFTAGDGAVTDALAALVTLGDGGFSLAIPDGAITGGNARGVHAIDLQIDRAVADQVAAGARSAILGGQNNKIGDLANDSIIVGGVGNDIGDSLCLVHGSGNSIDSTSGSSIVLGDDNTIAGFGAGSLVLGSDHTATTVGGTILGGNTNTMGAQGVIAGGFTNSVTQSIGDSSWSGIFAGRDNTVQDAPTSVILGGTENTISSSGGKCTIVGGGGNEITGSAYAAFVIGELSSVSADHGMALGVNSSVTHEGAVLWTDSEAAPNSSQAVDEFRMKFDGGYHFTAAGIDVVSINGSGAVLNHKMRIHGNGGEISMYSPDGTEYLVSVANGGTISVVAA